MMRQVFWGLTFAAVTGLCPVAAQAQLFGPSDEEKAHEASQDSQLNQLSEQAQQSATRIQALEDKVRSLTDSLTQATGATENLSHQLDVLNDKLERQSRDFAYRLCTLSAQQLGADAANLNCGASGASPGMMSQPQQMSPGAPLPPLSASGAGDDSTAPARGRPPGVLGTLPANGGPTRLSSAAPVGPSGGGATQFDSAMNLLAKAQYAEASAAFRAYADSHPDDADLAPQAIYWVGDIGYVQQDYPGASRSFAELIKKYPTSSRAPDAMLKLGQSLLAMGEKPEGCTTLGALKSKFPEASQGTLEAAATARKAAACTR